MERFSNRASKLIRNNFGFAPLRPSRGNLHRLVPPDTHNTQLISLKYKPTNPVQLLTWVVQHVIYITCRIILTVWFILPYDQLVDRRINDVFNLFILFLYYVKQKYSMFQCVCSIIDLIFFWSISVVRNPKSLNLIG